MTASGALAVGNDPDERLRALSGGHRGNDDKTREQELHD
jgi:hypothetical protein